MNEACFLQMSHILYRQWIPAEPCPGSASDKDYKYERINGCIERLGKEKITCEKSCRNKEDYPEPYLQWFIENNTKKTEYDKWIQPYNIIISPHLLMISKIIKEDHHNRQD